jgi:hypothetical protein
MKKENVRNKVVKHNIETATKELIYRKLDHIIEVVSVDNLNGIVYLKDKSYGYYSTDIKSLCRSTKFPLIGHRKFVKKLEEMKSKYEGKEFLGVKVLEVFYGPDKGYKNRSFYFRYIGQCGHECIDTKAVMSKHRKTLKCRKCASTSHGARAKVNGVRPKRSPTYTSWVSAKKILPEKFHDFAVFLREVGEKPSKTAVIKIVDDTPMWEVLDAYVDESELSLMASSLRQSFRHSRLYKECLNKAKIVTSEGVRYMCNNCKGLFPIKEVQVDHIDPVQPISGRPLEKNELIDRIWTDKIQVLDRKCHLFKSQRENSERRENKKLLKKAEVKSKEESVAEQSKRKKKPKLTASKK